MAAGILLSRLAGLVRQRVLAHALGLGDSADAFAAAFRIPNFLQNLLGEGVLSASFIPAYSRLRQAQGDAEARRLARAVLGLLALVVALVVALGVTFAPALVAVLAPGFEGSKQELTVRLVRVFFPRHRAPGTLGLVPRRPQQSPAVLPVVRRAGRLKRRHRGRHPCRAGGGPGPGHHYFTILFQPNTLTHPRLGFAISKQKVRLAVGRNRLRRLVRESFRKRAHGLPPVDMVVLARDATRSAENGEIVTSLDRHWARIETGATKATGQNTGSSGT